MDVSKFQMEGEWLDLEVKSEKKDKSLRLRIKPLSAKDQSDLADAASKDVREFFSSISKVIIDWDLTQNGEKLPCNDEEKEKYLPFLIGMEIKEPEKKDEELDEDEEEEKEKFPNLIGFEILKFAQNFDNFIKN